LVLVRLSVFDDLAWKAELQEAVAGV